MDPQPNAPTFAVILVRGRLAQFDVYMVAPTVWWTASSADPPAPEGLKL